MIRLQLPLPPSGNRSSRHGKGRHYTPEPVKAYREIVFASRNRKTETIKGDVALDITVLPWRAGGIDLDNRLKVLLDSLQHAGYYTNDKNVALIVVRRGEVMRPHGAVIVEIEEL